MGKGLRNFTVGPAPEGTLDRILAASDIPILAIDLRQLSKDGPATEWFKQRHACRSIGAGYSDTLAPDLWSPKPAGEDFDLLLFVRKTTAAIPNHECGCSRLKPCSMGSGLESF